MSSRVEGTPLPLHQHESFRILVLRVIESFVYKSLDETISLLKITTVINSNPLLQLVRTHISPEKTVETLPKVTIRDVILSITKIFQSSDIQILANNDNFKIKLSREDFQGLIDKHYGRYQENAVDSIRDDEEDYEKVMKEISMIEKGELDQLVVQEYKQSLPIPLNKPVEQPHQQKPLLQPQPIPPKQTIQIQENQEKLHQPAQHTPQTQTQEISQGQNIQVKTQEPQSTPEQNSQPANQSISDKNTPVQKPSDGATDAKPPAASETVREAAQEATPAPAIGEKEIETKDAELSSTNTVTENPVEVEAPAPEATSPSPVVEESDPEEVKKENGKRLKEKAVKSETIEHDKEKSDIKDDVSLDSKKRRPSRVDDKTPAKKKAKLSSSVPSSPAGPLHAQPNKKLQILSNPLIANITSYKYASTFLQPVSESNAPDYYSLIKEPRDLKTIKQMVKDGRIQNAAELERDILLMFANAIMYNKDDTDIYNWAKEMQIETDKLLQLFKESDDTT